MKIGKREGLIVYFTVLISVILVFYQVIYKPKKEKVEAIKREIQAVEADLAVMKQIIPYLPEVEKEIVQDQKKLMCLETRHPAGKQIIKIIRQLAQESSRLHFNLVSIKPLERLETDAAQVDKTPAGSKKITFRIQIRSQYQAFADFLQALEHAPTVWAVVEDFQILKKEDDEMGVSLDILLQISSYVA